MEDVNEGFPYETELHGGRLDGLVIEVRNPCGFLRVSIPADAGGRTCSYRLVRTRNPSDQEGELRWWWVPQGWGTDAADQFAIGLHTQRDEAGL